MCRIQANDCRFMNSPLSLDGLLLGKPLLHDSNATGGEENIACETPHCELTA